MRIENQNTNFGAIRVKGIKSGTKQAQTLDVIAKRYGETAQYGLNWMKKPRKYIQTQNNSATQRELVSALKRIFKENKNIKVATCSEEKAFNGINRPYSGGKFINWLL